MALIPTLELTLAVVAAALCAVFALPVVLSQGVLLYNRSRLHARVIDSEPEKGVLFSGLLRNGVGILRPIAGIVLEIPWFRAKCERCVRILTLRGYTASPPTVGECLLTTIVVLIALLFFLTGMLPVALAVTVLLLVLMFGKVDRLIGCTADRLVEQIPDALRSLGICFNAGYSLQQAFEQTAVDTPDPLGSELKQACFDVSAGRSIEEALAALEERTAATDLRFAIVALEIQHKTGGSLQELLENATDAVLASAELRRQLSVQTAQARLSAKVVTVLPLVLVAVLSLSMEGYLQTFFSSPEGFAILALALGMEAIGVLIIRRILGVDVG